MTHDELLAKIDDELVTHGQRGNVVKHSFALRAVVELHTPVLWRGIEMVCDGCGINIEQNYNSRYPCETIQAIEKELG